MSITLSMNGTLTLRPGSLTTRTGSPEPNHQRLLGLIDGEQRRCRRRSARPARRTAMTPPTTLSFIGWPPVDDGLRGCGGRAQLAERQIGHHARRRRLPESTMILLEPPSTRSMVSRYMRSRVTSGAFLYCS